MTLDKYTKIWTLSAAQLSFLHRGISRQETKLVDNIPGLRPSIARVRNQHLRNYIFLKREEIGGKLFDKLIFFDLELPIEFSCTT